MVGRAYIPFQFATLPAIFNSAKNALNRVPLRCCSHPCHAISWVLKTLSKDKPCLRHPAQPPLSWRWLLVCRLDEEKVRKEHKFSVWHHSLGRRLSGLLRKRP